MDRRIAISEATGSLAPAPLSGGIVPMAQMARRHPDAGLAGLRIGSGFLPTAKTPTAPAMTLET